MKIIIQKFSIFMIFMSMVLLAPFAYADSENNDNAYSSPENLESDLEFITRADDNAFYTSGKIPTFSIPIPIIQGGTGVKTMTTPYAPIIAGSSSTNPLQVASTGLDKVGYVLTSNGTSEAPSFQKTSLNGAVQTITGNSGNALSGSNITLSGGSTGLSFNGSGTTQTLTGTLAVGNGGTGVATLTQYAVLIGEGTSAIQSASPTATSGIPLVSQGTAANPAFSTAVVAGGGTGVTTMTTAYAPVCAGTTATGPLQVASTGLATVNYVLTSNGSGALPSFQDVSAAGAIKTISGNSGGALSGSNITLSGGDTGLSFNGSGTTQTLAFSGITANAGPVNLATDATTSSVNIGTGTGVKTVTIGSTNSSSSTTLQSGTGGIKLGSSTAGVVITNSSSNMSTINGTAGQVLTAQGADNPPIWQTGGVQTITINLTNAQIKTLRANPITLIPSPDPNVLINIIAVVLKMTYGGTNAFTANGGQALRIGYNNPNGSVIITTALSNSALKASSTQISHIVPKDQTGEAYTNAIGLPVVLYNSAATEIAGNAANNNTLSIVLTYQFLTI